MGSPRGELSAERLTEGCKSFQYTPFRVKINRFLPTSPQGEARASRSKQLHKLKFEVSGTRAGDQ